MIRKAYILTFDIDNQLDYKEFHEKLIALPEILNWFHYIKSSYILISNAKRATALHTKIVDIIPNKRFIILELSLGNENGRLPLKAWEWINKEVDKKKLT